MPSTGKKGLNAYNIILEIKFKKSSIKLKEKPLNERDGDLLRL